MTQISSKVSWLIITIIILFNLVLYFPETTIKLDPNDNIFQFALVKRTSEIWTKSDCPLSLSCFPNLIDHWVPNWAEGYPLPYYYSHLPQITIVASYNLIVEPISSIFHPPAGGPFSIFHYYNWTKYLLLALFPLSVYIAFRVIGQNPILAALAAFFATQLSTDGLYGIDPPSYLWRGYGLTSQLYSVFFIPLAIAFTYKVLEMQTESGIRNQESSKKLHNSLFIIPNSFFIPLAILFTTLSIAGHLGIGVILLLTLPVFLFIDFQPSHIITRAKKLFIIAIVPVFLLSYWIIPAMLGNTYHLISFWDPVWKFNSYGFLDVLRQFFQGELFDWKRFPTITILVAIGAFSALLNKKYRTFTFAFLLWILLFFGRATWGGLIDLIPGMKDFHLSRFIVGVHITALFIIPFAFISIYDFLHNVANRLADFYIKWQTKISDNSTSHPEMFWEEKIDPIKSISFYSSLLLLGLIIFLLTMGQTIDYATLNNKWINESNSAYDYQYQNYQSLLNKISSLTPGRVYSGRPGNWGRDFRFSSTQLYLSLSLTHPISQFLPESWSPNSDNEEMFDERSPGDYDLYNIRYIVTDPAKFTPPDNAQKIDMFGPFTLYQIPTSGYFKVVTSNMMVDADKNTLVDIVHLWQKSFVRLWNMYPLVTFENQTPPASINREMKMTDLTNYLLQSPPQSDPQADNPPRVVARQLAGLHIFANYPFSFPQATISGKIKHEEIKRDEKYIAQVQIPQNCQNCFTLFKMTYHPNWSVTLDGKEVEKFAAFPFFIAIPTPPGTHTLEFQYKPGTLKIILLIIEFMVIISFLFRIRIKLILKKYNILS